MYNNLIPLEIIEYYLNNGSLRKTAKKFNIHYQTLYKWIKKYKEIIKLKNNKELYLFAVYKRHNNRVERKIEEIIISLKEKYPDLTIRKAVKILKENGIKISIKGVYNTWKRYGYTGFRRDKLGNNFLNYIPWSKEAIKKYEIAKYLYKNGKIREAADILNSIPALPYNELIIKIPNKYLNFRRRFEKLFYTFGDIPLNIHLKEIRKYALFLKRKNLNYSFLRLSILEAILLEWNFKINLVLKKINQLKKYSIPFELKIPLLIIEGICYSCSNIKKSKNIAKHVFILLKNRKKPSPYLMLALGSLYSNIFEYDKAEKLILNYVEKVDEQTKKIYKRVLSNIYFNRGEYKKAFKLLKESYLYPWIKDIIFLRYILFLSILNCNFQKALSIIDRISCLTKNKNIAGIWQIYLDMAFIYACLNESKKAKNILKKLIPFLKKNKLFYFYKRLESLIKDEKEYHDYNDILIKIIILLKNGKYHRAISIAKKKGVMRYFQEFIVFFPKIINIVIKTKKINLPKYILSLPVFNKEIPLYHIKFLNKFKIYKNGKYVNIKLSSKEQAFLIHLSLKAGNISKSVNLNEVCKNFWPKAKNPLKNLNRLVYNIKIKLGIPKHLIEINRKRNMLINKGVNFTTDYLDFILSLHQVHQFLEVNNWELVKRELLKLIKIPIKEILKRFYDSWSEDLRTQILMKYKDEIENLKRESVKRRDYKTFYVLSKLVETIE